MQGLLAVSAWPRLYQMRAQLSSSSCVLPGMRHLAICALAALLAAAPEPAAQERAAAAGFEAVSIKPNNSGVAARAFRVEPGGNLRAINVTVRHLMWNA